MAHVGAAGVGTAGRDVKLGAALLWDPCVPPAALEGADPSCPPGCRDGKRTQQCSGQPSDGGVPRERVGSGCAEQRGQVAGRGGGGRAYGAAHGHMTARYWSRHATWKVTCALSGKVTVTASPCTGCVHHAQARTGYACRCPGRVASALCLPFLCSTSVKPPRGCRGRAPCGMVRTLPTRQRPGVPRSQA
jgi:hypothetical protein